MSIQNAISFIHHLNEDESFRNNFYETNPLVMDDFLVSQDLMFSTLEIEEAYRKMLLNCQSYEQAYNLQQLILLYQVITQHELDIPNI